MTRENGPITVYVCTTCRPSGDDSEPRLGARLLQRLQQAVDGRGLARDVAVAGVECLSVCKRPATVAFAGDDRWTYVYGDVSEDADPETLIDGIMKFGRAGNGIVPWKLRPDFMKRGIVARIPPAPGADAKPDASMLAAASPHASANQDKNSG